MGGELGSEVGARAILFISLLLLGCVVRVEVCVALNKDVLGPFFMPRAGVARRLPLQAKGESRGELVQYAVDGSATSTQSTSSPLQRPVRDLGVRKELGVGA